MKERQDPLESFRKIPALSYDPFREESKPYYKKTRAELAEDIRYWWSECKQPSPRQRKLNLSKMRRSELIALWCEVFPR